MKLNWERKSWSKVADEFDRLLTMLIQQGDKAIIRDMIPFITKKNFVIEWHKNDKLDQ